MIDSWEYDLAKEFKTRDNKIPMGPCIGRVQALEPEPVLVIQGGTYRLNNDQIYVCKRILSRFSSYSSLVSKAKACNLIGKNSGGDPAGIFEGTLITTGGLIDLDEVWEVGDLVLVIPSVDEQCFFIVDILTSVKKDGGWPENVPY